MLPATTIVAPNSPRARANASTAPPRTDGHARGRLMVTKILAGDAPSVAATRSYRSSTCSKPALAVRTRSGRPMMAIASTTAFHVKTTSMPTRSSTRPTGPRRPSSMSRMRPVATGGITSGRDTNVSTRTRPGKRRRASSHATTTPGGSTSTVAPTAQISVNQVIRQTSITPSAALPGRRGHREGSEAESFEDERRRGAAEVVEETLRLGGVRRRADDRGGIPDARSPIRGHDPGDRRAHRDARIGAIDDRGVSRARFHRGERGAHAAGRHDARLDLRPQAFLLQVLLRVHTGGHCRRIAERDPLERGVGDLADALERARPIARHHDRQLVREEVDAGLLLHQVRRRDDVHLFCIGADEEVNRGALTYLAGQRVGGAEIELNGSVAESSVLLRDGRQGIRQADGGRNSEGLRNPRGAGAERRRDQCQHQCNPAHSAKLSRMSPSYPSYPSCLPPAGGAGRWTRLRREGARPRRAAARTSRRPRGPGCRSCRT